MTQRQRLDRLAQECLFGFLLLFFPIVVGDRRFRRAPHIEAMCFALERAARGETKRLIITVPPRHLKSVTTAMAFVAWVLGQDPTKRIMVASYGADLGSGPVKLLACVVIG